MRPMRAVLPVLTLLVVCAGAVGTHAQQNGQPVTVPLSDPSRPGTLTISLLRGGITIRGVDRKDVLIEARSLEGARSPTRSVPGRAGSERDNTGLRRLPQMGGFDIEENNNQVVVTSAMNRGSDFTIQVPRRTHLKLSALNHGPIVVENVEGEIEVNNQNGPITLTSVAGSVVANTMNGSVKATMTRLAADKAMAFTSFNGDVDVTLPAASKANLKMRSDRGEIFTDFDIQIRPTTQATAQTARRNDGRIRIENQSLQGSVNGGGPGFELRTFNGNIYVRKGPQ